MSFNQERLLRELLGLAVLSGDPTRLVIAYSGGLDSTVLLQALAAIQRDVTGSPCWQSMLTMDCTRNRGSGGDHCATIRSNSLGVEFTSLAVDVMTDAGKGSEAAARTARYDVFRSLIREGDWLLSAHHKDDQAETLLLNLMRGSGPSGLAGIAEYRTAFRVWVGWCGFATDVSHRTDLRNYADTA